MKTIHEVLETPVAEEADVLVCGGGPAGFGAAVAAARAGARTLLLEASNCLGGMATAGMMSHWSGCESSPLGLEITERMRRSAVLLTLSTVLLTMAAVASSDSRSSALCE